MAATFREFHEEQLRTDPDYRAAYQVASGEFELSERLIDLRERLGLNQREAAERIGMKPPHLSRLETGESVPTLHTIWRLADAYNAYFKFGPHYSVEVIPELPEGFTEIRRVWASVRAHGKPAPSEENRAGWIDLPAHSDETIAVA